MSGAAMEKAAVVLVYVTVPTQETASHIAHALVEERLAACANLLPAMTSVYVWEGNLETAQEVACLFKTTEAAYPELEARVKELHPAVCPCIVQVPVTGGNPAFLDWVRGQVGVRV